MNTPDFMIFTGFSPLFHRFFTAVSPCFPKPISVFTGFHRFFFHACVIALISYLPAHAAPAPPLPSFDFTDPAICAQWVQPHHITALRPTAEGLEISINGIDPYFYSPLRDYPTNELWLDLKLRSDTGGDGQIFWFTRNATEENSAHFQAPAGEWATVRLPLPPLGKNHRLRIDPPGTSGKCVLASLRFTAQPHWALPKFSAVPPLPQPAPDMLLKPLPWPIDDPFSAERKRFWVHSHVTVKHLTNSWCAFELATPSRFRIAQTHPHMQIGYLHNGEPVWFDPNATAREIPVKSIGPHEMVTPFGVIAKDPHGANWTITHHSTLDSECSIEISISVDQDREIIFLPILMLCVTPGNTNKHQAIFPGLEYLANEPSSSEADLNGPASKRFVPDDLKITYPSMALLTSNHWVSLTWQRNPRLAAFFDSPDRTFNSDGHVMGLIFPGSNGQNRTDGRWLPNEPARLKAGEKLTALVEIKTGTGTSLQPAIEDYVKIYPLPPLPAKTPSWDDYLSMTAGGWLDSKCRESNLVRHAVWEGFNPAPAADAAAYIDWLASQSTDPKMIERLTNTAASVLSAVPPANWAFANVSHVRLPVAPLVYGHVAENQKTARNHARGLLAHFTPEGAVLYHASPGKDDYGRTYFTNHANGLTAQVTSTLLDAAAFSGDRSLIDEALKKVRALKTLYHDSVPRGAQTWEVPLHTPDILASAYLLRATSFAYELTGEKDFLDQASYWAWTGVPFVYLVNPVEKEIGTYTTIAVFGATGWRAPVWMGLPVQWCGLVYADALYRAGRIPGADWQKLADGITAAGIQVSWPTSDKNRQGLLPDSFILRQQQRDGPAINPGTLQACAARYFKRPPLYDCRAFGKTIVHAPGEITIGKNAFEVNLWPRNPAWVLVNGLSKSPRVKINGQAVELAAPHEYDPAMGSLRLKLQGRVKVEIE